MEGRLQQLANILRPALVLPGTSDDGKLDPELARFAIKRHRIGPLLHRAITKSMPGDTNDTALSMLKESYQQNAKSLLKQKAALANITSLLEERGIPFSVLKGIGLAEQIYDNPAARQAVDLDILIPDNHCETAIIALHEAGYGYSPHAMKSGREDSLKRQVSDMRRFKDLTFFDPKFRVSIELHQRLLKLEPKQYFADFIRSVDFARYPAVSSSHYCLYLLMHGAIALWPRLKWVADMSLLFRAMQSEQFQQILELAEKYDCRAAVIASLKLAEKTFPGSLSEAVRSSLGEASKNDRTSLILKMFEDTLTLNSGTSSDQPVKQPLFFDAYRLIFGKQFSLAKIFQYRIANSIALRT